MFAYQCNECLCRHGDWIPHTVPRIIDAGPWLEESTRQVGLFE